MKYFVLAMTTLFPFSLAAGSLVPITEDDGLSGRSPSFAQENTHATVGLSTGETSAGLQGHAPESLLVGTSDVDGLHGEGHGEGLDGKRQGGPLIGFVAPPPPPEPAPAPEPIRFELRDLQFEYDSAVLTQAEASIIAELAAVINRTGPVSITLIGYTDRRGSAQYNLRLSERRAIAVRDALVEWHGFDLSLFEVIGRGEQELVSAGISESDHARDRRVVVILN